jgi:5'(3')-deoxyribonucleotidase
MITLYLDMDGVLADFNKEYIKYDPMKEDRKKFRSAVMEHHIFEKLEFMPDTQELLNHVSKLTGVTIEILTSMGTREPDQAQAAKHQKMKWLDEKNIPYKANFVHSKQEKANYAGSTSILIDDSIGCISPYIEAGGHGILHVNATDSIRLLDSTLKTIRE